MWWRISSSVVIVGNILLQIGHRLILSPGTVRECWRTSAVGLTLPISSAMTLFAVSSSDLPRRSVQEWKLESVSGEGTLFINRGDVFVPEWIGRSLDGRNSTLWEVGGFGTKVALSVVVTGAGDTTDTRKRGRVKLIQKRIDDLYFRRNNNWDNSRIRSCCVSTRCWSFFVSLSISTHSS